MCLPGNPTAVGWTSSSNVPAHIYEAPPSNTSVHYQHGIAGTMPPWGPSSPERAPQPPIATFQAPKEAAEMAEEQNTAMSREDDIPEAHTNRSSVKSPSSRKSNASLRSTSGSSRSDRRSKRYSGIKETDREYPGLLDFIDGISRVLEGKDKKNRS